MSNPDSPDCAANIAPDLQVAFFDVFDRARSFARLLAGEHCGERSFADSAENTILPNLWHVPFPTFAGGVQWRQSIDISRKGGGHEVERSR